MKNLKKNEVSIAGNISSVDLRNGQNGVFGTVTIALDDGYYQKDNNGQNTQWVDRTHFVDVKVDANNLSRLKTELMIGDQLEISGKLIIEKWQDKDNGQNRSAMKVNCKSISCHIPKALIELGKQHGLIQTSQKNQNQNQNRNSNQGQNQGWNNGSSNGNGYMQKPPQGNNGFSQNYQSGYQN